MWKKELFQAISFYAGFIVPILAPVIVLYNLVYVPIACVTFWKSTWGTRETKEEMINRINWDDLALSVYLAGREFGTQNVYLRYKNTESYIKVSISDNNI